jgi:hypothetical protein
MLNPLRSSGPLAGMDSAHACGVKVGRNRIEGECSGLVTIKQTQFERGRSAARLLHQEMQRKSPEANVSTTARRTRPGASGPGDCWDSARVVPAHATAVLRSRLRYNHLTCPSLFAHWITSFLVYLHLTGDRHGVQQKNSVERFPAQYRLTRHRSDTPRYRLGTGLGASCKTCSGLGSAMGVRQRIATVPGASLPAPPSILTFPRAGGKGT